MLPWSNYLEKMSTSVVAHQAHASFHPCGIYLHPRCLPLSTRKGRAPPSTLSHFLVPDSHLRRVALSLLNGISSSWLQEHQVSSRPSDGIVQSAPVPILRGGGSPQCIFLHSVIHFLEVLPSFPSPVYRDLARQGRASVGSREQR